MIDQGDPFGWGKTTYTLENTVLSSSEFTGDGKQDEQDCVVTAQRGAWIGFSGPSRRYSQYDLGGMQGVPQDAMAKVRQ